MYEFRKIKTIVKVARIGKDDNNKSIVLEDEIVIYGKITQLSIINQKVRKLLNSNMYEILTITYMESFYSIPDEVLEKFVVSSEEVTYDEKEQ